MEDIPEVAVCNEYRSVTGYTDILTSVMIGLFRQKELREYYNTGNKRGINPDHASKLARIIDRLDASVQPSDMDLPSYHLHKLTGREKGI